MHIHFLLHVPFETPGVIETWAEKKGHVISHTRFYLGDVLPDPDIPDGLVIMGGPMSVHDEKDYAWLGEEKLFIKRSVGLGKKVLGICLGSQLVAGALGAPVFRNPEKEIGFMPVRLTEAALQDPLFAGFPEVIQVFHWHGETFSLPEGAILLASTPACRNQAYRLGSHVLGLQFHPELTEGLVKEMIKFEGHELLAATSCVHPAEKILSELNCLNTSQSYMFRLCDRFFS